MDEQLAPTLDEGVLAAPRLDSASSRSPLLYGTGVLAICILLESAGAYTYFFYVEVLGLAMAMAAVVKMVYAVWNSVNDPIFGFLSDNTRSRWGRRHVWLIPGMLLTNVVFVLVFSMPGFIRGPASLFWYMLVVLLLFETLTTVLVVNYVALFPEYFHGLEQRSTAAAHYQAGKIFAVLIGLSLTPLVYGAVGFTGMAVAYAILSAALLALALFRNREDPGMQIADRVEFLPAVRSVLKDRLFWKFSLTITFVLFGVNMIPFTLPFYVKHALGGGPGLTALLSGAALGTCLLVLPVWARLVQRWKIRTTFTSAVLILSVGTVMMGLPATVWTALAALVVIGIAWGGIWICYNIIRADLISQNLVSTGNHTEGLYYGLLNVFQNMGGILQSVAILLASLLYGYVSGENPGPQPAMAFRFLMSFAPFAVLVLSWYFARSFLGDYPERAPA